MTSTPSELAQFVGRGFTFDDGARLTVIQVKEREGGWWITFEATFPGSLPRRSVMPESQFIQLYGYLFVE